MKIRPADADLFQADGQANEAVVAFRGSANAHKKQFPVALLP